MRTPSQQQAQAYRQIRGRRGRGGGLGVLKCGLVVLVFHLLGAPAAVGQTRFSWPDTTLDFVRYTSYEQCAAAANRLQFQMRLQEAAESDIWWDTMPYNARTLDAEFIAHRKGLLLSPALQVAHQAAAQRCAARFPIDSVPTAVDMMLGLKQLPPTFVRQFSGSEPFFTYGGLLAAARDSTTLLAYLDRRLQGASPEEITQTLISATNLVGDIHTPPANHRLYAQIVERYAPRLPDRVERAYFYNFLLLDDVDARQDTAAALGVARRLAKFLADSLTPEQRDSFFTLKASWLSKPGARLGLGGWTKDGGFTSFDGIIQGTYPWPERTLADWLRHFTDLGFDRDEGLDSLRKSTDAYLTFVAAKTYRNFKGFAEMDSATKANWDHFGFGRPAPPLKPAAWAGPKVTGPRPTPGRTSLLVFFHPRMLCNVNEGAALDNAEELAGNCMQYLVPLRQLMDSFPELEVTVVTRAYGYFRNVSDSMTPATEAELVHQMLVAAKITTVPVAISNPGHRNLPEPDGRPLENAANDSTAMAYSTNKNIDSKPELGIAQASVGRYEGELVLVDPDGRIVAEEQVAHRQGWSLMSGRIRALLDRKRTP